MPMQERKAASSPKKAESWATRRWFVIEHLVSLGPEARRRSVKRYRAVPRVIAWKALTGRDEVLEWHFSWSPTEKWSRVRDGLGMAKQLALKPVDPNAPVGQQ
jgi:hypothetical protein